MTPIILAIAAGVTLAQTDDASGWQIVSWIVLALWFLTLAIGHYEWRQLVKINEKTLAICDELIRQRDASRPSP